MGNGEDVGSLEVARRTRGRRLLGIFVAAVVVAVVAWVCTHPASLPREDEEIEASTPVGQSVFVGVFSAPPGFDRSLAVSGVKVRATSSVDLEITPWLCRGGSVRVTSTPEPFCSAFVDPAGQTFTDGDSIVLEVSGPSPGAVDVERIRLAYRDGVQWGTHSAGSPASVTILSR